MKRDLIISSQLININKVRVLLQEVYQEYCLNMNSFNQVFLGISEAVHNAIVHGNKLNPEKNVSIRMNLSGNQFHVEVEDEGEGFLNPINFDPTFPENIKCENGRGIYILRQLVGQLVFKDDGRKVFIQFNLPE